MGKKLLEDQLGCNTISKIDIAAYQYMNKNKCTNSQNNLFNFKAERFKFPHADTDIERYSTKQSPPDIIASLKL